MATGLGVEGALPISPTTKVLSGLLGRMNSDATIDAAAKIQQTATRAMTMGMTSLGARPLPGRPAVAGLVWMGGGAEGGLGGGALVGAGTASSGGSD